MKSRKLSPVLFVLVFLLTSVFAMPAFAEDAIPSVPAKPDSTADLTVDSLYAGDTLKVYKIVDVAYDEQHNAVSYAFNDGVKAYFTNAGLSMDGYDAALKEDASATDSALASWVRSHSETVTLVDSYTVPESTAQTYAAGSEPTDSHSFTNLPMGRYLVLGSGGASVFTPMAVTIAPEVDPVTNTYTLKPSYALSMKRSRPTIEKTVKDSDNTVSIGDTLEFLVSADVPGYASDVYQLFRIYDKMSTGLKLVADSVKVYGSSDGVLDATDTLLVENTNYSLNSATASFTLELSDDYYTSGNNYFETLAAYQKILVVYNVLVTSDITTREDAATNSVELIFNNDPYDEENTTTTPPFIVHIFTYKADVHKVAVVDSTTTNKTNLSGVKFKLYEHPRTGSAYTDEDSAAIDDATAVYFVQSDVENGKYSYTRAVNALEAGATDELVTDADGYLHLDGLDVGSYTLKETYTPDGFALPLGKDALTSLTVTATNENNAIEITNDAVLFTLPRTGGTGTWMFTLGGLLMMSGAVVLLFVCRKHSSNK